MADETSRNDPSTMSADGAFMAPAWSRISDVRAGRDTIIRKGEKYLPKWPQETRRSYDQRLMTAPWRPEFSDVLENLASKPFARPVKVNDSAPESILGTADASTDRRRDGFVDDVDGQGNSLHVFARDAFADGVADGVHAIYVAYPDVDPGRTVSDERAIGARPYWVHVPGPSIIALRTRRVAGREVVEHIRYYECVTVVDGFAEKEVRKIRVLELDAAAGQPTSQLWKPKEMQDASGVKYELDGPLIYLRGVKDIPVALFFTGERSGSWRVKMPLADLADMQLELYRALSRQDNILTFAGFPMLKGTGMTPPKPKPAERSAVRRVTRHPEDYDEGPMPMVDVGPGVVLFAPPAGDGGSGDWGWIQPAADNLRVIEENITCITENLRRLGRQPTTTNSGNLTATGAAIEGAKAHSAVEAWANGLADCLDQAFVFTCQWMNEAETVSVSIYTDFGVGTQGDAAVTALGEAQKRKVISAQTEREELARRGILGPSFDEEQEQERLAEEADALEPEEDIDPRTGKPIPPMPPVPPGPPQLVPPQPPKPRAAA